MNKKLTVNRLALGNLKARKKQYAIMIIGIILAMVFSSSAIFFASCINSSKTEMKNIRLGQQHYVAFHIDKNELDNIVSEDIFDSYVTYDTIGYAYADEKENTGISLACMDEKALDAYNLTFIEGAYPQHKGEIAIEQAAFAGLGIDAKVGDKINLKLLACDSENYVEKAVDKEYTLVGIVTDRRSEIMFSDEADTVVKLVAGAYVSEEEKVELGGKARTDALAFLNLSQGEKAYRLLSDYLENNLLKSTFYPTNFSNLNTRVDYYSVAVVSIIIAITFFIASSFAIINAFSSNLSDRKKQIGMMRTVGATKRQIINVFGREALIIAAFTSPVSLVISYFAVKIFASLVHTLFVFRPERWIFPLCLIISVASVMISALVPLVKASKTSPIQAVRNTELTYTQKKKKIKSQKEYDVSKLMAKRTLSFSKGKQATVCVFLVIIVLIGTWGSAMIQEMISGYQKDEYDYTMYSDSPVYTYFTYNLNSHKGFTNNDLQYIRENPYVERVYANVGATALLNKEELNDYDKIVLMGSSNIYDFDLENVGVSAINENNAEDIILKECIGQHKQLCDKFNITNNVVISSLNAYDAEFIKKLEPYVIDGKINIDKIISGEEMILVAPKNIQFTVNDNYNSYGVGEKVDTERSDRVIKQGTLEYKAGDEVDLSVFTSQTDVDELVDDTIIPDDLVRKDKKVKIGAIVNNIDSDIYYTETDHESYRFFTTLNIFEELCPEVKYTVLQIDAVDNMSDDIDASITQHLQAINDRTLSDNTIISGWATEQASKRENTLICVAAITIVIIMLAICVSIINNSLTAQIRAGKRQMGTLRAVGASQKEMVGSYIHQLRSMLLTGSIAGFALYGLTYLMHILIQVIKYRYVDYFRFSILPAIVCCIIIFGLCSLNLWSKIRKEMKNSIIDNIREL